ncbi:RrF2 family transcriptional regulator [Thermomonospora cellulosilytica]|uniref:Rrf2 family nitric oxide-sensitive transcriptional repressor n=1 Tax=Thermomonospora cellulosilytica TaxID=1411118 RepID=A0A7W3RBU0_9ACTN|nr:Rrf2 family transcriptional regulator [Thermomonospora cellulosilytica]MBA9007139.1 Rrf2 family nitric oxide-sensitive transcriptional repressor [Thermomonospora cellulosilytica]
MRLTRFTDLALRIAMRLAVADPAEVYTTRQVAEAVNAPYTHVAKVVGRLSELGVVEARRGRGGGLVLTERGRDASIGALMRELEGAGDVAGCEDSPPCPLRSACRLRDALRRAQEAFYAALDPVTVRDLVDGPSEPVLVRLLDRRP